MIFGEHNTGSNTFLGFENETTGTITVTYELEPDQIADTDAPQSLRIPPGSQDSFAPIPHDDYCIVAPVVAADEDGLELLRLPSGYCYRDDQSSFDTKEG